jgi:hypothetical protein
MSTALAPLNRKSARALTDRINATAGDLCLLLLEAHDREAWKALGYGSWREYATAELRVSQSRAYQVLDHGRVTAALLSVITDDSENSTSVEITEAVARDIKPVLPEVVTEIRERVAAGESPVAAARQVIDAKREERKSPSAHNPAPHADAVRRASRRPVDARIRELISAAQNMRDVDDDDLAALDTNDLMLEGLHRAVEQINRIIALSPHTGGHVANA